ncbi:hypothetical protein [Aureimonas sp. ME7]|uniref:hypothetical protein n=1 Tax=Aureimonas sp. ME7 TaxID=2744252 RepID=UPI0015F3FB50|nr:hypothetical protein [Aureimonas sp. ME7]
MRIGLNEISSDQVAMLSRLNDAPARDSVGLRTGELSLDELRRCLELHALGLVSATVGWRDTCWFALTPAGRRIRRQAPV